MFRRHFFLFFYSTCRPMVSNKARILRTLVAEWTYSGFTRVEWCCIVYRLVVDPTLRLLFRRTRYSALVYVTEKRRIGHTVAPILEVEHRWYRHQRSAAKTDISAERMSSSTPGKFAKLFGPFLSNRREHVVPFFFSRFNRFHIDISASRRIACYPKIQTMTKSKRENVVKTYFYFSSRTVYLAISDRAMV